MKKIIGFMVGMVAFSTSVLATGYHHNPVYVPEFSTIGAGFVLAGASVYLARKSKQFGSK